MPKKPLFNILMYSHDTYGLGHIRRTIAIASHLASPAVNVLILTGSPLAGRFRLAEGIDFVRVPGMIKKTNEEYRPLSIRIDAARALAIRESIIRATAKAFKPELFIVDKEPLGLKKEVLPTLEWLRKRRPSARAVLGLRDIMDEASVVRRDWREKGVHAVLESLYDEIWVYGERSFYDPVEEYAIPDSVGRKMVFTGYIPRESPGTAAAAHVRGEIGVSAGERLVMVTTGGGGDGALVLDAYLSMLEAGPIGAKSVIITGPFLAHADKESVKSRAERLGVACFEFHPRMEELLAASDLAVIMGGYNTVCEILSQKKVSLIIPRETPRKEQLIRAQALARHGLADFLPWPALSPEALRAKVSALLAAPGCFREAMASFRLTGIQVIRERLLAFCEEEKN